jgi:AraC family transcriptional regulator
MQSLAARPIDLSSVRPLGQAANAMASHAWRTEEGISPQMSIGAGNLVRRHVGVWSNATATVADIFCDDGLDLNFRFDRASIVMPLEEVGGRAEIKPVGYKRTPGQLMQSGTTLTMLPAGCEAQSRSDSIRFLRLFTLDLDPVHHITGASQPLNIDKPVVGISDARLSKICRLLAQECRGPDFNGPLYADNLVLALGIILSRFDDTELQRGPKGGLAPWQLRRVQDYMRENISQTISVKVLADLAQVSMTHFSRAFKASVGCAPHQWMTENRVERAKRYLLSGELPIVEISLCLGFCDQAHFTRVFHKAVGDTPLTWQRTRRP